VPLTEWDLASIIFNFKKINNNTFQKKIITSLHAKQKLLSVQTKVSIIKEEESGQKSGEFESNKE
jgi:hypothetical protein